MSAGHDTLAHASRAGVNDARAMIFIDALGKACRVSHGGKESIERQEQVDCPRAACNLDFDQSVMDCEQDPLDKNLLSRAFIGNARSHKPAPTTESVLDFCLFDSVRSQRAPSIVTSPVSIPDAAGLAA